MKKMYSHIQVACLCLFSGILMNGCVKDSGMKRTRVFMPIYKTSEEVRASIKTDAPVEVTNPGKLFVMGNYIYLNEVGKGIHIIDNSNPASPVNKAFIHIPGNGDLAVKGTTLYADCFTDLMAIDISNPAAVKLKATVTDIFPDRQYVLGYDVGTNNVIVDWAARDTVIDLEIREGLGIWKGGDYYYGGVIYETDIFALASSAYSGSVPSQSNSNNTAGVAGSMSRFALIQDYLFAVTNSRLNVVNISNSNSPQWKQSSTVATNSTIETIFPFKDKLFIGSTQGMYIYNVSNPETPVAQGQFLHARSCDPVIADDNYAYVTQYTGSFCGGSQNILDVVDIKNLNNPALLKSYTLTNPHGLSKDGNLLFICDGLDGLKLFDAKDPANVKPLATVAMSETYDVISYNKVAIVSAKDGLYQYDYSNTSSPKLLSKISLQH